MSHPRKVRILHPRPNVPDLILSVESIIILIFLIFGDIFVINMICIKKTKKQKKSILC